MANIREQVVPSDLSLRPDSRAEEALANSGRRIGALYGTAAEAMTDTGRHFASAAMDVGTVALKHMEHTQISKGAADGAQLTAKIDNAWNETAKNADPNDPTVADTFREKQLEPLLDKFKSGFSTERSQQWAEQFADNYRKHMFEKTSADMSTLAGIAVKTNFEKTKNLLSSSVASDPTSLDFALSQVDHSVGAMADSSPNLGAAQSTKVKSELAQNAKEAIVKSAVFGMIQKNPNVDLDAVQKKYGEYVNGAEMKTFQKAAQTQAKVDLLQQKQIETYQRQENERKAEGAANDLLTKNVSLDPQTGRPTINPDYFKQALDIARMPNAPVGLARTLIDWGEHQQNLKAQPQVSDPIVKQDLTDRLFSPDKPTTTRDLMIAQTRGKLSDHDFTVMHRLVTELETTPLKGPLWTSTAAAVKDALIVTIPGLPGKDSKGTEAYSSFMQAFLPEYIAKSRAGTLPPNALNVRDPNSMISQAMEPFKRTPAQRLSDYTASAGGIGASPATSTPVRKVGDVAVPAALGGVASLQYNPGTKQWRDQASGAVYDSAGNKVSP